MFFKPFGRDIPIPAGLAIFFHKYSKKSRFFFITNILTCFKVQLII